MSPTGGLPSRAAAAIYRRLWDYERRTRSGRAYADNTGFLVERPAHNVVWDVDVLREGLIQTYRATAPDAPTVYRRGDPAEAAPAVPGWSFPVDEIFEWRTCERAGASGLRRSQGRAAPDPAGHR